MHLYVHIPFCKSKCEYCDFYSLGGSRDRRTTDQYLQALADHIRETGRLAPDYTVDTVYFGGGTPSFFGAENLEKILDELQKRFHFGADPEITLEANPDSVTPQGLKRLVRAGFNRISIGVQSDQDDMLKRLGRPHTYEQARMAVEACAGSLTRAVEFLKSNERLAFRTRVLEVLGCLRKADDWDAVGFASELVVLVKAPLDVARAEQEQELAENADFLAKSAIRQIEARNKRQLTAKTFESLRQLTAIVRSWLRDVMAVCAETPELVINVDARASVMEAAEATDEARAAAALAAVRRCDEAISYNVSPETCIDAMLFEIREVLYGSHSAD